MTRTYKSLTDIDNGSLTIESSSLMRSNAAELMTFDAGALNTMMLSTVQKMGGLVNSSPKANKGLLFNKLNEGMSMLTAATQNGVADMAALLASAPAMEPIAEVKMNPSRPGASRPTVKGPDGPKII